MNKTYILICLLCAGIGLSLGLLTDDYFETSQPLVIPDCPACNCPPAAPLIDWQKAKNIKGGVHVYLPREVLPVTDSTHWGVSEETSERKGWLR